MKRIVTAQLMAGLLTVGLTMGWMTGLAAAGERRTRVVEDGPQLSEHPKSQVYRNQGSHRGYARGYQKGPQVRGYVQRRGGYSYSYSDGVIDYRDASILRDHQNSRRQGGPFDSGFFFDSGIHRHNDSPYLN